MEPAKAFFGLLNGVARREYHGDASMTAAFLQSELYEGTKAQDFNELHTSASQLIEQALDQQVTLAEVPTYLETFATTRALSPELQQAFAKFWKSQRAALLAALTDQASWEPQLTRFAWRVDAITKTSHSDEEVNQAKGLLELQLTEENQKQAPVLVELDHVSLKKLIQQMEGIEQHLSLS